ncbi:MAG: MFS transporter, partial [Coriobacteriales bacterium]
MMRHRKKENPTDTAELAPVEATAPEPATSAGEPVPDPGQPADSATRASSKGYVVVAIVYLLGIFMGAIDMNIVNPARTVIQNTLSVPDELGVWLMTIYTLAYAASIPVMGKLADRHGRKYIYLLCVLLFGVGSLLCGLSQDVGSFEMLIASRAIQAIGGGGIMPVATAEFGTAFPPEKRGMALGLVGGIYGVASILGSTAGSFILDVAGSTNWQFIFYVNIPICLFILVAGLFKIPNTKEDEVKPIDGLGTVVLTVMVLSLMYGLKNIDFFEL